MDLKGFAVTPEGREAFDADAPERAMQLVSQILVIIFFLGITASIVYATGGTGYAYPYVILLPVILSAAWFGLFSTVLVSLIAGLLLGPLMPMDVDRGLMQSYQNWLARICFFALIAVFTSWLFQSFRASTKRHLREIQIDRDTGLPNQAALKEDLKLAVSRWRYASDSSVTPAVVLIRMQDLWEVMEAMGTETANKVARQLADNINSTVDREHHLYRFSTSELMLLFLAESHKDVDDVASAVRRAGEYESEIDGIPIRVQLVVGSYLAERSISEPDVIVNRARKGLFAAINSNVFYRAYEPSIDQQTVERIRLISSVRRGLSDNEFVLFYQPKICLTTGRHVGGEGLLRWLKEDGSIVFPGLFMPKLENTTLIDPVTRFVVDKACNDINAQQLSPISINFSTKNLMDNELVQNLSRSVQALGVEPQMLEIEITEGALIRNPAHAKVAIQSLRDQGFSVSLDDFGTGYSSFEYLSQLPLSGLKIDRAFVSGLEQSAHARAVLKSMVDVAHALNLKITIEGIETAAQHQIVSELGAHQAQGFYYSKAIPVSEYANWHWEGDGPAESDRGVVSNSGQ
jgi:EAL domain-containing protein (putative c-di-GMP-specific phosphodiesterase class I)/GGDEF domain-containing protein